MQTGIPFIHCCYYYRSQSQTISNDHPQRTLGAAEEGSNRLVSPFVVFVFRAY